MPGLVSLPCFGPYTCNGRLPRLTWTSDAAGDGVLLELRRLVVVVHLPLAAELQHLAVGIGMLCWHKCRARHGPVLRQ